MNPQFLRAYVLVRFVSLVAEHVATFVIPVAIYLETQDIRLSGLAYLLQWLPQVLALPLLGHLADRFDMRRQFVALDVLRAGLALTIPLWSSEVAMMAMIGLLGLASGHNLLVMETFLARHCPPELVASTQARIRTAYQSAVVLGPALGGLLIGVVSVTAIVLTVAAAFLACAGGLALLFARLPPDAGTAGGRRPPFRPLQGFRLMLGSPVLVRLAILMVGVNFVGGLFLAQLPAIVTTVHGEPPSTIGFVAALGAFCSIASLMLTARLIEQRPVRILVVIGGALMASGLVLAPLAPSVAVFTAAFVLWTCGQGLFTIWMRTLRLAAVPKAEAGQVLSVFIAVILAGSPASGLAVALLGSRFAPVDLIAAGALAAIVAAGAALAVTYRPRLRTSALGPDA